MRLQELKARVDRHDYEVDSAAVAGAILSRLLVRRLVLGDLDRRRPAAGAPVARRRTPPASPA